MKINRVLTNPGLMVIWLLKWCLYGWGECRKSCWSCLSFSNEEVWVSEGGWYVGSGSEELVFVRFVKSRTCYDVMPYSSKLVVFDTQLKVSWMFFVENFVYVRMSHHTITSSWSFAWCAGWSLLWTTWKHQQFGSSPGGYILSQNVVYCLLWDYISV